MDTSTKSTHKEEKPAPVIPILVCRAEATTGEGAIWHPDRQTLFWVDIEGKTLYEYISEEQACCQ